MGQQAHSKLNFDKGHWKRVLPDMDTHRIENISYFGCGPGTGMISSGVNYWHTTMRQQLGKRISGLFSAGNMVHSGSFLILSGKS